MALRMAVLELCLVTMVGWMQTRTVVTWRLATWTASGGD